MRVGLNWSSIRISIHMFYPSAFGLQHRSTDLHQTLGGLSAQMDDSQVFIYVQFITGHVLCDWVGAGSLTLVATFWVQWGFLGRRRYHTDQERNWVWRCEKGMDIERWGGGGWEGKELHQTERDFATEADMKSLLTWARRRWSTQTWRNSAFLENCREMTWSLLLLDATLIFTKPLFLFAFLFPVPVSTGYLYLQSCSVWTNAMGEGLWDTLSPFWEDSSKVMPELLGCWLAGSCSLHCPPL